MSVQEHDRYRRALRQALADPANAVGRPVSIREVAERVGVEYETIRRLVNGGRQDGPPLVSRELNQAICGYLGLDAGAMWTLVARAKALSKFGAEIVEGVRASGVDGRLAELWPRLRPRDRAHLLRLAEAFAAAHAADSLLSRPPRTRRRPAPAPSRAAASHPAISPAGERRESVVGPAVTSVRDAGGGLPDAGAFAAPFRHQ